jgi:hypothetical protein
MTEKLIRHIAESNPYVYGGDGKTLCFHCRKIVAFYDEKSDTGYKSDHKPGCWYVWCCEWVERHDEQWPEERKWAIVALRSLCGQFGDNDWSDDLHLADVIDKHLARRLWSEQNTGDE